MMKRRALALTLGMALISATMPANAEPVVEEQIFVEIPATAIPSPVPTEIPTPEPTAVPTPEPTPVPTPEPTPIPTPEPVPEWPEEVPGYACAYIALENAEPLNFGDLVVLRAVVENADVYSIRWEIFFEENYWNGLEPWVFVGEADTYAYYLNETNFAQRFRVVVNDALYSEEYMLPGFGAVETPVPTELPEGEETVDGFEGEETPAPEPTENPFADSAYERDANGALRLDGNGNPIPIFDANAERLAVAWARDEYGQLLLDDAGEPIAIQYILLNGNKVGSIQDALDPDRFIDIYAYWGGGEEVHFGDQVQLFAHLNGYDNATYTLQWQTSVDGEEWTDVQGATLPLFVNILTEENYMNLWRVELTITEAEETDQSPE